MILHRRTVEPVLEPVAVRDLREHLRITATDQDNLLNNCLRTARAWVESVTNRALLTQTWSVAFDNWPPKPFYLPYPPFVSVTSFTYRDTDAASQDITEYSLAETADLTRVSFNPGFGYPSLDETGLGQVTITYVAGATKRSEVPEPLRWAITVLAGSFYETPSTMAATTAQASSLPYGVAELLAPFTIYYHVHDR